MLTGTGGFQNVVTGFWYLLRQSFTTMLENYLFVAWGNGKTGRFTGVLFFIPLAENITFQQYLDYYDGLLDLGGESEWDAFACRDLVGKWEDAVDKLPSANNLKYGRNNPGTRKQCRDYTIDLMADSSLNSDFNRQNGVIYQAIESYVELAKGRITGKRVNWEGALHGGGPQPVGRLRLRQPHVTRNLMHRKCSKII